MPRGEPAPSGEPAPGSSAGDYGYGDPDGGGNRSYGQPGDAGPGDPGGNGDGPPPGPATDPAGPATDPAGPATDPAGPATDPVRPDEPAEAAAPPPVVAATPALRGYPGGPGLEPAEDVPAVPAAAIRPGPMARDLNSPSVWQQAQRAWRESGVEWQQSAAGREPAEAGWERAQAPSASQDRRPGRPRPSDANGHGKIANGNVEISARSAGGALRLSAGALRLPGGRPRGGTRPGRRGAWPLVIVVIVVLALVVTGLLVSGGSGARPARAAGRPYPPARLAGADFGTDPGQQARGVFQSVSAVAASGATIVAVGSLTGQWIPRAQFLVSADGGHSWRLAAVRGPGGAVPSPAGLPLLVAAGPALPGGRDGWLALGRGTVWTSQDGMTWTLAPGHAIVPVHAADRVLALARTGRGYLAVGEHVPPGDPARSSPVAWTSPDGLTWQRIPAAGLHLAASGGRVSYLNRVAARGSHVIVEGAIAGHHRPAPDGVWRSTDGGARWTPSHVPAGRISGIAATGSGFVAIRPGRTRKTGSDAVAYVSAGGSYWNRAAALTTAKQDHLKITAVGGSDQGAVVSGQVAGGARVAWVSTDGTTWRSVASLGGSAQLLAGVTVTAAGTVVGAGSAASSADGRQPYLVLAGARARTVSFRPIPGATGPALKVSGIAVAGGTRVAVGTADGYPAIWSSSRPGRWRRPGSAALTRPGLGTLAGVVHGRAGWLAVGGTTAGTSSRPVVVTSVRGASWQAADGETAFTGPGITASGAASGRSGYVIVGRQVVPARTVTTTTRTGRHKHLTSHVIPSMTIAAAWWSAGLAGWARGAGATAGALAGTGARQMNAVTAARPGFVAVGSVSDRPAVWTSPGGQRWALTRLPAPAGSTAAVLQQVAAQGRVIVATGTQTTPAGTVPFAEYSADGGSTWRQAPLPAPRGIAAVTALTATGTGFEAAGTAGPPGSQRVVVWSSRGGVIWKAREPAGTGLDSRGSQAITALAASGSRLTGAGYLATPTSEQPTLWLAAAAPG